MIVPESGLETRSQQIQPTSLLWVARAPDNGFQLPNPLWSFENGREFRHDSADTSDIDRVGMPNQQPFDVRAVLVPPGDGFQDDKILR